MTYAPRYGGSRESGLAEMLAVLFPEPSRLSHPGRFARSGGSTDYLVIPDARNPKLMLPSSPSHLAASAVQSYRPHTSPLDRAKRTLLSTLVRTGLGAFLFDRIRITPGGRPAESAIDCHLADVLGRTVRVGLHIGPARAVRKPVLQLMSEAGHTFAFAKIGDNAFTRELVRAEAETIELLTALKWRHLVVPSLIHRGQWRGTEVMVLEALESRDGARSDAGLAAAMAELARSRGTTRERVGSSTYLASLQHKLSCLPATLVTQLLRDALDDVRTAEGEACIEFGSWHGDWAPWNMTTSASRALVWDWEMFQTGVPVGFDAIHFAVQSRVVASGTPPAEAFSLVRAECARLLKPFGVDRSVAATIVTLYAIEIAIRYLRDGELEAGSTPMTRLSSWLPVVLNARCAPSAGRGS